MSNEKPYVPCGRCAGTGCVIVRREVNEKQEIRACAPRRTHCSRCDGYGIIFVTNYPDFPTESVRIGSAHKRLSKPWRCYELPPTKRDLARNLPC